MRTSFKPEQRMPTAIPGQIVSGGTAVWPHNVLITDEQCIKKLSTGQFSPTQLLRTTTPTSTTITKRKKKLLQIKNGHSMDFPSHNDYLADYSTNGRAHSDDVLINLSNDQPYTLNTEWLVWIINLG